MKNITVSLFVIFVLCLMSACVSIGKKEALKKERENAARSAFLMIFADAGNYKLQMVRFKERIENAASAEEIQAWAGGIIEKHRKDGSGAVPENEWHEFIEKSGDSILSVRVVYPESLKEPYVSCLFGGGRALYGVEAGSERYAGTQRGTANYAEWKNGVYIFYSKD